MNIFPTKVFPSSLFLNGYFFHHLPSFHYKSIKKLIWSNIFNFEMHRSDFFWILHFTSDTENAFSSESPQKYLFLFIILVSESKDSFAHLWQQLVYFFWVFLFLYLAKKSIYPCNMKKDYILWIRTFVYKKTR